MREVRVSHLPGVEKENRDDLQVAGPEGCSLSWPSQNRCLTWTLLS